MIYPSAVASELYVRDDDFSNIFVNSNLVLVSEFLLWLSWMSEPKV